MYKIPAFFPRQPNALSVCKCLVFGWLSLMSLAAASEPSQESSTNVESKHERLQLKKQQSRSDTELCIAQATADKSKHKKNVSKLIQECKASLRAKRKDQG